MTSPKPSRVKPVPGYLYCDTCRKAVPFYGPDGPWPQHRCAGWTVAVFDRFSTDRPEMPAVRQLPPEE
jgi:hypothetical protein